MLDDGADLGALPDEISAQLPCLDRELFTPCHLLFESTAVECLCYRETLPQLLKLIETETLADVNGDIIGFMLVVDGRSSGVGVSGTYLYGLESHGNDTTILWKCRIIGSGDTMLHTLLIAKSENVYKNNSSGGLYKIERRNEAKPVCTSPTKSLTVSSALSPEASEANPHGTSPTKSLTVSSALSPEALDL